MVLTAIFHLVAFSRRRHLRAGSDIVKLFFVADFEVLALHRNPLDLASSSSFGHAANLSHWAHEWLVSKISLVVLQEAECEVLCFAFPAMVYWWWSTSRPVGGLCCVVIIGGNWFREVVSAFFGSLGGSKSKSDSEKFHFVFSLLVVQWLTDAIL